MDFKTILARTGKWTLSIVVLLIVGQHWKIIDLSGVPIPSLLEWLYGYLLINGIAATPFIYLEKRGKVKQKICPQCDSPLQIKIAYSRLKCGNLHFIQVFSRFLLPQE